MASKCIKFVSPEHTDKSNNPFEKKLINKQSKKSDEKEREKKKRIVFRILTQKNR